MRELKMILDGQNEIYRSLKTLLVKLDEVVGRQERELSMLTMISQHQSQAQPQVPPSDHRQVIIMVIIFFTPVVKMPGFDQFRHMTSLIFELLKLPAV